MLLNSMRTGGQQRAMNKELWQCSIPYLSSSFIDENRFVDKFSVGDTKVDSYAQEGEIHFYNYKQMMMRLKINESFSNHCATSFFIPNLFSLAYHSYIPYSRGCKQSHTQPQYSLPMIEQDIGYPYFPRSSISVVILPIHNSLGMS